MVTRTGRPRPLVLLALGMAAGLACRLPAGRTRPSGAEAPGPAAGSIVEACRSDLAARLKIELSRVEILSAQDVVWPDAALGLDRPGEAVAQVRTPGQRLVLGVTSKARSYVYASGGGSFRYGGPLDLWKASALTVEETAGDPNLNGRLVQCSLVGTNRAVLLEGVAEIFPQENGALFSTRRTSRSGHDLLYAAAGQAADGAVRIDAAFDFVDAVVSPDGSLGAALARTGPEPAWRLDLVHLKKDGRKVSRVDLPKGVRPERLRWVTGETWPRLVLLGKRDGQSVRFGLASPEVSPNWESLPAYVASDDWDFVLSKSHSLAVYGTDVQGRPAVKVEYVWWNRPPEEIATLPGLKLDDFRWVAGREFVFVSGRADGAERAGYAGLTVDIDTGEVLTAVTGAGRPVRLFKAPPRALLAPDGPSDRN